MTWICYRGIELSARTQQFLLGAEIAILAAFAVVALVKTYSSGPPGSMHLSLSWFNPFDMSISALVDGVLLGIFIYWGWDSGVSVNEESEDSAEGPGKAAVVSTVLLLLIYVIVSAAAQAYGGTEGAGRQLERRPERPRPRRFRLALEQAADHRGAHLGRGLDPDDDPAHRPDDPVDGALGCAAGRVREGPPALPDADRLDDRHGRALDRLDARCSSLLNPAQDVLGDSITAIGFAIAFYYGFAGFASAWYFRHELRRSPGVFFKVGLLPLLGGLLMLGIFVKALHDFNAPGYGYAAPIAGIQVPIVIGIGALLLGLPLMVLCALKLKPFFRRKTEVASRTSSCEDRGRRSRRCRRRVRDGRRPARLLRPVHPRPTSTPARAKTAVAGLDDGRFAAAAGRRLEHRSGRRLSPRVSRRRRPERRRPALQPADLRRSLRGPLHLPRHGDDALGASPGAPLRGARRHARRATSSPRKTAGARPVCSRSSASASSPASRTCSPATPPTSSSRRSTRSRSATARTSSSRATTSPRPSRSGRRSRSASTRRSSGSAAGASTRPSRSASPRLFDFPEGIGPCECVNVEHEEVVLVPRAIDCRRVTFKYGLGDEFIEVLRTLHKLGLDSKEHGARPRGRGGAPGRRRGRAARSGRPRRPDERQDLRRHARHRRAGKDGAPRAVYLYHVADHEQTMREYGRQAVVLQTALNPVVALELLASGAWHGDGRPRPRGVPAEAVPRPARRPTASRPESSRATRESPEYPNIPLPRDPSYEGQPS